MDQHLSSANNFETKVQKFDNVSNLCDVVFYLGLLVRFEYLNLLLLVIFMWWIVLFYKENLMWKCK
jgi:hypothetical protein